MEKLDEKKSYRKLNIPKEEDISEKDIVDALKGIGITESEIKVIIDEGEKFFERNKDKLRKNYQLSYEEALIIFTYTYGNGNPEDFPYTRINEKLWKNDYEDQKRNPKSCLCMLLRALRKLSRTKPKTLYRSIRNDTKIDEYVEGKAITWDGFTSTSPSVKVTKKFITNPETKKVSGTLFEIRDMWGYDIADFSCHRNEKGFKKKILKRFYPQ